MHNLRLDLVRLLRLADAYHWVLLALVGENMNASATDEFMFSTLLVISGHLINSVVIGSCASLLLNMDHNAVLRQQQKELSRRLRWSMVIHSGYMLSKATRRARESVADDARARISRE